MADHLLPDWVYLMASQKIEELDSMLVAWLRQREMK
jgi:hypothetical protein